MTAPILAAATFCFTATFIHVASIVIAAVRLRRRTPGEPLSHQKFPPVSLVRPLCGIDNYAADTLRSTFALDYPRCEILFCVASAKDPVVPLIEALMAEHAGAGARLLIGDERVSLNPKLNNVLKGWRAAEHDWIVLADSNVLMPRDYIQLLVRELAAGYRPRRLAAGRLPAARSLGRTGMRVPQHLSGPLAVCRRRPWLRLRPGQDHAVAARRPRTRRRHRGARQGSRRRRRLDQDRARRRPQSAARRPAIRAAARLSQRRRGLASAVALGAAAARQLPGLFPPRSGLRRCAADGSARRRRRWRSICRPRSASPRWARSGMAAKCCSPRPPAGTFRRVTRSAAWRATCCCPCSSSTRCAATTSSGAATKCRSNACGRAA